MINFGAENSLFFAPLEDHMRASIMNSMGEKKNDQVRLVGCALFGKLFDEEYFLK